METTEILVTVPTWNEMFGWFVFYVWCGVITYTVYAVSFVVCDYGRYVNETKATNLAIDMFLVLILWPFAFKYIMDNFSYRHFNRPYSYYQ